MPHLSKYTAKRFYLPSTASLPEAERIWVEMRTRATAGDVEYFTVADGKISANMTQTIEYLSRMITAWNLTDPEGNPEPIGGDTVRDLEFEDYDFLLQQGNDAIQSQPLPGADQKKSSPSSAPKETA